MDEKGLYDLLARYFSGNCSETEKQQVENWRDASDANLEEFSHFRAIWESAPKPADVFSPDVEPALQKVNQKLAVGGKTAKQARLISLVRYAQRIAAAILVGLGIWLAYTWLKPNREAVMLSLETGNYQKEVVLSDGTHVWLNNNSVLHYPSKFSGTLRRVSLEGEGYFEVAKNADMPFLIETSESVVTVLGTKFNVRARKNETVTVVSVNEGKVSFTGKSNKTLYPVYLLAGDEGLLDKTAQTIKAEKNTDANYLSWKTGKLVFNNTPLKKVASDLSDYFGKQVVVEDSLKANIPFTSTFDHQNIGDILTILEMSLGVKADSSSTSKIILK